MNLNRLYTIADNENIDIYDWHIENCNGIYLNYDKINAIALNYDKLGTYIDEKCTLAEELGHYYMDATYNYHSIDNVLKSKQEYRAKKWSYTVLVPFEKLKSAIKNGLYEVYQLADYFEVTCEYMQNAVQFYQSKYGIIVS